MRPVPPDRLAAYRHKRNFAQTGEPKPHIGKRKRQRFVVQRHDARRLHYDLRLELDGVLLSWAVPNGPSFSHEQKRLAVRTEDHPIKYLTFEGVIPKGEYGGGTMIVWDRGTWTPVGDPHKGLEKGHIEFELVGERLKGRWHLVRTKPQANAKSEQWLLIKAQDEFARFDEGDPLEETSVLSGKKGAELIGQTRTDHRKRAAVAKQRSGPVLETMHIQGARKALLPIFVEPSAATAADTPPQGSEWWHEVKFDGYRIQCRIDADEIKLLTRSGLDWTARFSGIAASARELHLASALLDGEIVVDDGTGIPSFNALVNDLKAGRQDRFRYYLFDLIYLDGSDLRAASLADRKGLLALALRDAPQNIVLSEHFEINGSTLLEHAGRLGLEGVVSKRRNAPYQSGRTKDWLKVKCVARQEFVIVGFVPSTATARAIGSLVLGAHANGKLVHAGRVGTGFGQDDARSIHQALSGDEIGQPVFANAVSRDSARNVRWVKPRLVAEVEYRGWSSDELLRHSVFRGLREDRNPLDVVREADPAQLLGERAPRRQLTHPDRLLWPDEGVTKSGLADYYGEVADWLLPHIKGRPLSLVRCPGGIAEKCFYAKHEWAGLDASVRRVEIGGDKELALVVDTPEGLLSLAQANVLEIHPWGSTLAQIDEPDRLIFDLDPGDGVGWDDVIEAAREVRERLITQLGLESFVKTSGGKGLHVCVPLTPSMAWPTAKAVCKGFAESMARDSPDRFLAHMTKAARKGKVFVDYLRNGRGATAVSAYSARARIGAGVSTPLDWSELSEAIKSDRYRIDNIGRRLASLRSDPWAEFFKINQRLREPAKSRRRC